MVTMTDFSDCLLLKIFTHLDSRNLCHISGVCKRWYRLAFDRGLWADADLSPIVSFTNNYQRNIVMDHLADASKIIRWNMLFVDCDVIDSVLRQCARAEIVVLNACKIRSGENQEEPSRIYHWKTAPERRSIKCVDIRRASGHLQVIESFIQKNTDTIEVLGASQFCKDSFKAHVRGGFSAMRILDFTECFWINDFALEQLTRKTPHLESLTLYRCVNIWGRTMHSILNNCPKLTTLILRRTKLKDQHIIENEWKTEKIQELDISHCYGLDEAGICHVLTGCSHLTYLRCAITDKILPVLSTMVDNLEILEVRRRYPVEIEKLSNFLCTCHKIRRLDVSLTPIEERYFEEFLPFISNLQSISFAGHEILKTYKIINHLGRYCPNLRSVCINYYHAHNDALIKQAIMEMVQSCKYLNIVGIQGLYVFRILEELKVAVKELKLGRHITFLHPHKFKMPKPYLSVDAEINRQREKIRLDQSL